MRSDNQPPSVIVGATYRHPYLGPMLGTAPESVYSLYAARHLPAVSTRGCLVSNVPQDVRYALAVRGIGSYHTLGTDPEFFVSRLNGAPVPAFRHLPRKDRAVGSWFWDGFQAETTVEAVSCIQTLGLYFSRQVAALKVLGLKARAGSIWRVPDSELEGASADEVALGCDPSLNVYGMRGRPVDNPRHLRWRFAGGHIHISLNAYQKTKENVNSIIRAMDAFLGIPAVCLAGTYDHPIRRKYYGLAGEFRLPSHGIEYRTLSNFWLLHPRLFQLTLELARQAFNLGLSRLGNLFVGRRQDIVNIINYTDVKSARELMQLNREYFTTWSEVRFGHSRPFWDAIMGGAGAVLSNLGKDIGKAWLLSTGWTSPRYTWAGLE